MFGPWHERFAAHRCGGAGASASALRGGGHCGTVRSWHGLIRSRPRAAADRYQRIERALEVWLLTGKPLSSLQGQRRSVLADLDLFIIRWLPTDPCRLHLRCEERLNTMFAQGFVAGWKACAATIHCIPICPPCVVGYRQVLDVLEQRSPRERCSTARCCHAATGQAPAYLAAQLPRR